MEKILIIDDDKIMRYTLKSLIQHEGYEVEEAEDGLDGLNKIKKNVYSIVLCDIQMPKLSGIEVLEKARKDNPDILIVMISVQSDMGTVVQAIKKGAFDFISKPIDRNRFLLTLRNAMEHSQLINKSKTLEHKIKMASEMLDKHESSANIKDMLWN